MTYEVPRSLEGAKYLSLRSYKKDGTPVATPVWFATLDATLVIFTDGTSYKVKRIRRNPVVQVARCDVRGKVSGGWLPGRCRAVDDEPERIERAYAALNGKYGWTMRAGTLLSTLAGRVGRRLILEVTVDDQTSPS